LDAVEAAVNVLEDNPLFNAGRGAAMNEKAEIEIDASIMNGKDRQSGAVAIVKNIKNPVTLARAIMEKTKHISVGDMGALEFAQKIQLKLMPEAYFITDPAFEEYQKSLKEKPEMVERPANTSPSGRPMAPWAPLPWTGKEILLRPLLPAGRRARLPEESVTVP
jgi:isoaspartyl peptidase/L-asparaginase-like protein (Ntn-hydrolase superfamily)